MHRATRLCLGVSSLWLMAGRVQGMCWLTTVDWMLQQAAPASVAVRACQEQ